MNVIILKYGGIFHRTKSQNTHCGCFVMGGCVYVGVL